jgi:hypothetical protein
MKYYLLRFMFYMSYRVSVAVDAFLGADHGISEAVFGWHERCREAFYVCLDGVEG